MTAQFFCFTSKEGEEISLNAWHIVKVKIKGERIEFTLAYGEIIVCEGEDAIKAWDKIFDYGGYNSSGDYRVRYPVLPNVPEF